ncbi:hypothetical protein K503DRAFT_773729 [Rhizopogon vinicolor AM-OR11-026]|uniref:F-box domain-containing protein n=1 Tax=Rhizopogon vinicolor AM-OR11-026 TaxID=1314800 RepID=A0A1B7MRJ8_9AGAM|nr:hypothetical protein K503DRAFT_773729 [Rhizopogon vinicolor AM-OR11-026]
MSVSELRWNIFQMVDTSSYAARNMTLLALALTCKSFTGPALDLLWRELHGLSQLIRCLPSSLWKSKRPKTSLEFRRAMTLNDWSIFCKYSHRVQAFHIISSDNDDNPVSPEIWRSLNSAPFPLPLLPNLTSLSWSVHSSESFSYIRLFVTHKLMTLKIRKSYSGLSEQSILTCIPTLCPSVSHFVGDKHLGDTSMALQCWSNLISVSVGNISEAAILYLSNLPSLRVLKLVLHPTPIAADTQNLLQHPAFCALRELDVLCQCLAPLGAFLETLTITPKVLSFTIDRGDISSLALTALVLRLSNVCAHSALEHLRVNIDSVDANTSISAVTFEPLCAFRNLRELDFSPGYGVALDDATLLQMAKSWPLLEIFRITGKYTHAVTINSFVSLLQHCPRLTSVGIAIDWSAVDRRGIPSDIPYQGFTHNALSRADFSNSLIRHAITIAAFISAIAPKLISIVAWEHEFAEDDDFDKCSSRWEVVQRLVESFSMVREQERKMVQNAGGAVCGDAIGSGKDSEDDSVGESDTSFPSDSEDNE